MTNLLDFGDWLSKYLDDKNIKPVELARSANIDPGVITRIIKGERKATPETLASIAHALHLPVKFIFEKYGYLPLSADDPWSDQMNHKIGQLTGVRREMAERLVNTLLDEQDREQRNPLHPKTTPLKP